MTHKGAIEAATTSLGRYMIDREGKDIILRCSKLNKVGEWIWADIRPEHWSIMVESHPLEVGIFLEKKEVPVSVQGPVDTFLRGELHFTYWIQGSLDNRHASAKWAALDSKFTEPFIDRPESYAVSVDVYPVLRD